MHESNKGQKKKKASNSKSDPSNTTPSKTADNNTMIQEKDGIRAVGGA